MIFSTNCEIGTNEQIDYPGMNNYSQFSYDGLWRNTKIVETTSGSVTSTKQFIVSAGFKREERDAAGSVTRRLYERGQTISGTSYFYSKPYLDSISEMTDGSGVAQAQYSYDPYGRVIKLQGSLDSDFQYAGYYIHQRSGLNLTVFRAYSAQLGRWISRDPIEEQNSINLYAYSFNDPELFTDPTGLYCCRIDFNELGSAVNSGAAWGGAIGAAGGAMAGAAGGTMVAPGVGTVAGWQGGAAMGAMGLGAVGGFAGGFGNLINQMGRDNSGSQSNTGSKTGKRSARCQKVYDKCVEEASDTPPLGGDRCNQGMPFYNQVNDCMKQHGCPP